jgi:hypothetical protein
MEHFSQRELEHFFTEVRNELRGIHDQMKTTNGQIGDIQKWRQQMNGALKMVAFLGFTGIISLVVFWVKLL